MQKNIEKLKGNIGVGHVRYSTYRSQYGSKYTQPLVLNYVKGTLALCTQWKLVNTAELRNELAFYREQFSRRR